MAKSTRCSICRSGYETVKEINRLLIKHVGAKAIARKFPSLGYRSIERHKRHVAARLNAAWRRQEALLQVDTESLLVDLLGIKARCQQALTEVNAKEEPNGYASIAREARSCVESFAALQRMAAGVDLATAPQKYEIVVVYENGKPQELDEPKPSYTIVREPALPASTVVDVQPAAEADPGSRTH